MGSIKVAQKKEAVRQALIELLEANDIEGVYRDEDCDAEGVERLDIAALLTIAEEQEVIP